MAISTAIHKIGHVIRPYSRHIWELVRTSQKYDFWLLETLRIEIEGKRVLYRLNFFFGLTAGNFFSVKKLKKSAHWSQYLTKCFSFRCVYSFSLSLSSFWALRIIPSIHFCDCGIKDNVRSIGKMRLDQIYPEHSKALLDANLINPKKKLPTMKTLWKRDKEDTNEISTYAK